MVRSWIGLADRNGLKLLVPESDGLLPFIIRRSVRENAVCFWTILDESHANLAHCLLKAGEPETAINFNRHMAIDGGCHVPEDDWCVRERETK